VGKGKCINTSQHPAKSPAFKGIQGLCMLIVLTHQQIKEQGKCYLLGCVELKVKGVLK
jgi:hypothetical protein